MKSIKVVSSGNTSGTTIEVDGSSVSHVRTIRFEHVAGELPILTLEILAMDGIEIEGWSQFGNLVICPICKDTVEQNQQRIASIQRLVKESEEC